MLTWVRGVGEQAKMKRRLEFNEETGIQGRCEGGGLTFDSADPSVRVTRLSSDGGLM